MPAKLRWAAAGTATKVWTPDAAVLAYVSLNVDDEFFIIGNALNYAAIPGMFAMTFTIGGE